MINATPTQLRRAAKLKERIDALEVRLNDLLGAGDFISGGDVGGPGRRRRMSAAGRAAIAAAARARWARYRGDAAPGKPRKSKFSAAAKARLSALAKARWAKAKAAGKSRL
jgi:hypothetical protein